MAKTVLGIVAGIIVAFATVFLIDFVGHLVYPLPSGLDMDDYEAVGTYVRSRPAGASAFVLLGWFLAAADGGLVAALISRRGWTIWLITAVVAAAGIAAVVMVTHPVAMQIGTVVAALFGGLAARMLAGKMLRDGA